MEKKSVSATILVLFLALTFSVIGACFSAFVYPKTKITVENIKITSAEILVYKDKELKNTINKLELSDMELGMKPATGELDNESQIPSSITDKGTSEGYYSTIYVPSGNDYKIVVKDIIINSKKDKLDVKQERKNIFIAIKDVENTTKSLEYDEFELVKFQNVNETQKLTFYVWLSSLASDKLVGSKINFTLEFIKI